MRIIVFIILLLAAVECTAEIETWNVVVVANRNDPESIHLGKYYLEKREIPPENLLLLSAPTTETISWPTFIREIFNPLLAQLVERGWIDAITSDLTDSLGRRRYAVSSHKIRFLVLCRGMPLRINNYPDFLDQKALRNIPKELHTNRGSVDAELAMIAMPAYPVAGFVGNPLFKNEKPSLLEEQNVVKVARLDGPSINDAQGLIDNAILAEKHGLMGRAYIDENSKHPMGARWLRAIGAEIEALGYDLQVEKTNQTFSRVSRFDAPALYFGWYHGNVNGPFINPVFRFATGAIAVHIHSFSAATLRDSEKHWCGPLVARGAAATLGNVFEPFLHFSHHLDAFFHALARGETLGDAAYYALPALSWQAVLIGDPLYKPFRVPVQEQINSTSLDTLAYRQYAHIRQMRMLLRKGDTEGAITAGRSGFRSSPGLALGWEIARIYDSRGQTDKAARNLLFMQHRPRFEPEEWQIAKQAADYLYQADQRRAALAIYKTLIETKSLPEALLIPLLEDGRKVAEAAGQVSLARTWAAHRSALGISP